MKRIAVMTSGGDCAGMNVALRAVVRRACHEGLEVVGIRRGFVGLVEHAYEELNTSSVGGILHQGGTILRTFRCPDFQSREVRDAARKGFEALKLDSLVVIGGDGSFRGAHCIDTEWDVPTVGVPATIDNDIAGTDFSVGFATALEIATEAVDKIRDTATSHGRIFVIEVMGRNSGMLAMAASVCCGAEEFLIPERPTDLDEMCLRIQSGYDRGKQHAIIIVAEGAAKAAVIADEIHHRLARDVRIAVLGHIQRGGNPTSFDRIVASRLGVAAVERLLDGERDVMVGLVGGEIVTSPLQKDAAGIQPVLNEYARIQQILR